MTLDVHNFKPGASKVWFFFMCGLLNDTLRSSEYTYRRMIWLLINNELEIMCEEDGVA
jgi:hypothetical protein